MGTPSNALQAALYTRLTGYAPLTALLGASQVFDHVPQGASAPFVVIGADTMLDAGSKTNNKWECTVTVHAWDFERAGRKSVKAILSAIYDALHQQESSIAATGFTLVNCRFEFEETYQETAVEGDADRYYHGVQRYRAFVQA